MTVLEREKEIKAETPAGFIDCDLHPAMSTPTELQKYLPERWKRHVIDFGARVPQPLVGQFAYPRMTPGNGMRRDSWPPAGGPPASDLEFMRSQYLDPLGIAYSLMQPLGAGQQALNLELGNAMCTALNDWQLEKWCRPEPRLKGAISVAQEDAEGAVAEIERRANDRAFVQIAMAPRTIEPAGRKRYWPIYEAAAHYDLPISLHTAAYGVHTNSGSGWLSYYTEEHYAFAHSLQTVITSLIFEGVFERWPNLKVVMIEGGFAWLPSLAWRMDRLWSQMKSEVPHMTKKPSEYLRSNFWYTTQPIEEPEKAAHLRDILNWIGIDRLMFATDYPHWDYDDPNYAFNIPLSKEERAAIFGGTARALYRL